MYYRFTTRSGECLATGYNAETKKELADSYKSLMIAGAEQPSKIKRMSVEGTLNWAETNDLAIEMSETKFEELSF